MKHPQGTKTRALPAAHSEPTRASTPPRWVLITSGIAALVYALPSIWFLSSYMQPSWDLGIYDQALWLLARGETFVTVSGVGAISSHFSPVLYPASFLSLLPGGAIPEIAFQSLLIASGAIPAWQLARTLGQDPKWFVMLYAFHPAIIGGSWVGWRPWNLAVPVFMWFIAWILRSPTTTRIVVAGLTLLAFREDLAVWVGLLVLILAIAGRVDWKTLATSGLILGAATVIVIFVVLPALSSVDGYYFTSDTQVRGGEPTELFASAIWRAVFLLAPLAVAPRRINWLLMAPLALPVVGLMVRGGLSLTTFYQYDMMFIPLLILVVGLSTQVEFSPFRFAIVALLVMVGLGALRPAAPWGPTNPWRYDAERVRVFDEVKEILDGLPGSEHISMTMPQNLVPHYSERHNIFMYPHPVDIWRSSTGEPAELSTVFTCPEPTVLVAPEQVLSDSWRQAVGSNYTLVSDSPQPYSVWMRDDALPDTPCSAVRIPTG